MYRPEEKYKQKAAFRDYTKVPVFPIILWPHFDIFKKGSERVEGLTVHTVEMQSLTLFSIGERVQRTYMEIQFFNPILSPFGRLTLLVSGCRGPTRRCTRGRRWSLCAVVTRPGWDSTIWRPPSWRPWVEYRVKRWYRPFKSYTLILSGQRFVDPSTIYGVYRQSVM